MSKSTRSWLVVGIFALTGIILVTGTLLIARWFFPGDRITSGLNGTNWGLPFQRFSSNGERIFFTGQSKSGPRITFQTQGMQHMMRGRLACATCHGADGRGGTVQWMMSSFETPDIRYHSLTGEAHADDEKDHPPYTDEDIKRAIKEGVDPSGEPLDWQMPRWQMTDGQLSDLIEYLKSLE